MVVQTSTETKPELRDKFIDLVARETQTNRFFLSTLLLATMIATLGLLINSSAVVIGAMLIAPLFWPIIGVATGTVTTRGKLFQKSLRLLALSLLLIFATAYITTLFTPLSEVTPEILARTNPTILDLLIALASSIVGIIALYWPQLSQSMAGVAIAVALLPPLCVAGIGVAFGEVQIFLRALLLFSANLAATIFTGITLLYVLGFRPRRDQDKRHWRNSLLISALLLLVIAYPLGLFLSQTLEENRLRQAFDQSLRQNVDNFALAAELDNVQVRFPSGEAQPIVIEADILMPEGAYLNLSQKNHLSEQLSWLTSRPVDLELNIIRSLTVRRDEDAERARLSGEIEQYLTAALGEIDPNLIVESLAIRFSDAEDAAVSINLLVRQPEGSRLDYAQKQALVSSISDQFDRAVSLEIELVPIVRVEATSESALLRQAIEQDLTRSLQAIDPAIALDTLDVSQRPDRVQVRATIRIPQETTISFDQKEAIRGQLELTTGQPVDLDIYLLAFLQVKAPLTTPLTDTIEQIEQNIDNTATSEENPES